MLKIFVTGDNHIGLKYARHEKADVIINARKSAFKAMVEKANEEDCGLFVITGDLFENNSGILKSDIAYIIDALSAFKGIAAILPGNHDYYDNSSKLWRSLEEYIKKTDNVIILSDYRPYILDINGEKAVIYPAACKSLHSAKGENCLGWIKGADMSADGYKIGVAHGAVEGETIDSEGEYFPMTRKELEEIAVDVWLLGHTHVPFPRSLSETEYSEGERVFNAGTHVQTDVSCNTGGECFIIEIDESKNVRAKKFNSGNLYFFRKNLSLTSGNMTEELSAELEKLPENSIVDIILSGAVSAEEYEKREEVITAALSRFIEGTYSDYAMSKLISKELIDAEFPETSFSAGFLTALLDEPKEAQLAYELLKTLKEEN